MDYDGLDDNPQRVRLRALADTLFPPGFQMPLLNGMTNWPAQAAAHYVALTRPSGGASEEVLWQMPGEIHRIDAGIGGKGASSGTDGDRARRHAQAALASSPCARGQPSSTRTPTSKELRHVRRPDQSDCPGLLALHVAHGCTLGACWPTRVRCAAASGFSGAGGGLHRQ
jgi:hypothetical protein